MGESPVDRPLRYATQAQAFDDEYGMRVTRFDGPGYVCGLGFAIMLQADEMITSHDPRLDFITYAMGEGRSAIVFYEGNAPQPAEALIELSSDFPAFLAIHLPADAPENRLAEIERRIETEDRFEQICVSADESS